jgi:cold shock protein
MASNKMDLKWLSGGIGTDRQTENQSETASIIELRGVIKSFDVSKGHGIIALDNGAPDILLSVACLRRGGFEVAYEGARVVVEVLQCSRGLQAFRVFSMDGSTALPTQLMPPDTRVSVTTTCELARPEVKWFSRPRGVGFFAGGGSAPDVFVHIETLRQFGLTELLPSRFKGLMAHEMRPEDVPLQPASRLAIPCREPPTQASPAVSNMTAASASRAPTPAQAANWNAE